VLLFSFSPKKRKGPKVTEKRAFFCLTQKHGLSWSQEEEREKEGETNINSVFLSVLKEFSISFIQFFFS